MVLHVVPRAVGRFGDVDDPQLRDGKFRGVAPQQFQFVAVRNRGIGPERREQVVSQPGRAAGGLFGAGANPDRRMRPLHRFGIERHRLDLVELALESDPFLSPQPADQLDALGQTRRALGTRELESGELLGPVALSDTEVEAPVREDIDAGGIFGDAHGIMEWQQQDEGADANFAGARGDRCGGRQHGRVVSVIDEMMLGQPYVVVAEVVEHRDLVEHRRVQFGKGPPPLFRIAKIVHHAELHRMPSVTKLRHRGSTIHALRAAAHQVSSCVDFIARRGKGFRTDAVAGHRGSLAGGAARCRSETGRARLRGTLAAGACGHLFHAARGATPVAILIVILIAILIMPTSFTVLVVVTVSATAFGLGLCGRRFHR